MLEGSCHCGSVRWTFEGFPESTTACNCTLCRRYGTLWTYGHQNEDVAASGVTQYYTRDEAGIEFHFCPRCACIAYWLASKPDENGRRRMAVNLRLGDPNVVAPIVIDHFDGLETWTDLPRDGRCVKDMWF